MSNLTPISKSAHKPGLFFDPTTLLIGFGSPTVCTGMMWQRGEMAFFQVRFLSGISDANIARMTLPFGLTMAPVSPTGSKIAIEGWTRSSTNGLNAGKMIKNTDNSNTAIYFGYPENINTLSPYDIITGQNLIGSGEVMCFSFEVRIAGWS